MSEVSECQHSQEEIVKWYNSEFQSSDTSSDTFNSEVSVSDTLTDKPLISKGTPSILNSFKQMSVYLPLRF